MATLLVLRPPSVALFPRAMRARQSAPYTPHLRVRVGQHAGAGYEMSSSSSSTVTTEETTTGNPSLVAKLPLYALYLVIAGVVYYVGYKLISAAWASKAGQHAHYVVR